MKCVKCGKKAQLKVQNLNTCENCFVKIIEKRVRKEIRTKQLIKKNDRILIIDDGSAESAVSKYLLRRIIKDLPVKISVKKLDYDINQDVEGRFNKIVIPWCADKEGEYLLHKVFENSKLNKLGHFDFKKKKFVKILLLVSLEETELYAKIKKLKFKKANKSELTIMLDKLIKEYPELRFTMLKSAEKLKGAQANF